MRVLRSLAVEREVIEDGSLKNDISLVSQPKYSAIKTYPVRAALGKNNAGLVDHEALAAAVGQRNDRRVQRRVEMEQLACVAIVSACFERTSA